MLSDLEIRILSRRSSGLRGTLDAASIPLLGALALLVIVSLVALYAEDEALFPFAERVDQDRMSFARARTEQLAKAIGIDAAPARAALGRDPVSFAKVGDGRPRSLQSAMLDLALDPDGSIVVLEAETGSGKTEAALLWFLRLFQASLGGVRK